MRYPHEAFGSVSTPTSPDVEALRDVLCGGGGIGAVLAMALVVHWWWRSVRSHSRRIAELDREIAELQRQMFGGKER